MSERPNYQAVDIQMADRVVPQREHDMMAQSRLRSRALPNPFMAGELVADQPRYEDLELHVPEEPVNLQPRLSLRERFWKRVKGGM